LRHLRQRFRNLHRDQPALRDGVIEGRDGLSLFDHWRDSYKTLHGITSRGFPNQFFTGFIQGGVSANTTAMFEQQAKHIAYIISEAVKRNAVTVEPSREAEDGWVSTIREFAIDNSQFEMTCTPGYYNNEGGGGGEGIRSFLGEPYSLGFYAFDDVLKEWRAKGDLNGLVLITDDVRKLYETLKARGVTDFTQEPTDHFYGTDMGVRDPFGNAIRILQQGKVTQEARA